MKSILLLREPSNQAEERLWSTFDACSKKIKAANVATKGGTQSENQYKIAYQDLVREGLAARLKRKYRG